MINEDNEDDFETVLIDSRPMRILKDGHRMRVPMVMADAAPQNRRLLDGRGGPAGQRPCFVFTTDAAAADAKRRAYDEYNHWLVRAYETPPWSSPGAQRSAVQTEDAGPLAGAYRPLDVANPGSRHRIPEQRRDASTVLDARVTAYADFSRYLCNAWRR